MKMKYMNFYNPEAMKIKIISIAILTGLCSSFTIAQAPDREKLEAYKIAFFTKRLDLSPREAEKFWPLYNDYQKRKTEIQRDRTQLNRQFNLDAANMSEKELIAAGDRFIELQVAETELAVTFHKNIKTVLTPEKVLRLYQSENQYRLQLLKQLQERIPQRDNLQPERYKY